MVNNRIDAPGGLRSADRAVFDNGHSQALEHTTPHLATGFFFLAVTLAVTVFIAGTMDSQIRLAGLAVVAVVASMIIFWMVVAQPAIEALAAARAQHEFDQARQESILRDIGIVTAEKEQGADRVGWLGGVLAATQQELDQEIAMLGVAIGDAVDASEDGALGPEAIGPLKLMLDRVQEGQRNVSAIARLGTTGKTDRVAVFRASDVTPLTIDAVVSVERNDEIYGDVDLWRLFVKNAARNSETHGHATEFTISSGDGRLILTDNGRGCTSEALQQAWKAGLRPDGTRSGGTRVMRRIADAHDGFVTMQGEPDVGVRIVVDLRDLEIDLRDRRVVPARIRTPHKASGGRINPRPIR